MNALGTRRTYGLERLMMDLQYAARTARSVTRVERAQLCGELADRLREELEPRAAADEEGLEAIRIWLDALAAADPSEPDLVQELLYGVDALVRVHIWRETGEPLRPPERTGLVVS
jgi:hypothetical protein